MHCIACLRRGMPTDISIRSERQLEQLSKIVGGYVEQVRLVHTIGRTDVVLLVNEDGVSLGLIINKWASVLYGCFRHYNVVLGESILIGVTQDDDGEEEWTDLPEDITLEWVLNWIEQEEVKHL